MAPFIQGVTSTSRVRLALHTFALLGRSERTPQRAGICKPVPPGGFPRSAFQQQPCGHGDLRSCYVVSGRVEPVLLKTLFGTHSSRPCDGVLRKLKMVLIVLIFFSSGPKNVICSLFGKYGIKLPIMLSYVLNTKALFLLFPSICVCVSVCDVRGSVRLGCCTGSARNGVAYEQHQLFLTVHEPRSPRSWRWQSWCPVSLCPQGREDGRPLWGLFSKGSNPIREGSALLTWALPKCPHSSYHHPGG